MAKFWHRIKFEASSYFVSSWARHGSCLTALGEHDGNVF